MRGLVWQPAEFGFGSETLDSIRRARAPLQTCIHLRTRQLSRISYRILLSGPSKRRGRSKLFIT